MAPPPKNHVEVDARNRFGSYQLGWRTAARGRPLEPRMLEHPDAKMVAAYRNGHADYNSAQAAAFGKARKRYRVPGTEATDILR